jgi:hypothetical protein
MNDKLTLEKEIDKLRCERDDLRSEIGVHSKLNSEIVQENLKLKEDNERLKKIIEHNLKEQLWCERTQGSEILRLSERADILEKAVRALLGVEQLSLCSLCMRENEQLLNKFYNQCRSFARETEQI